VDTFDDAAKRDETLGRTATLRRVARRDGEETPKRRRDTRE
jgi:hypothetical protein